MSTILRTVSQLRQTTSDEMKVISPSSLVEVSYQLTDGSYTSRACPYGLLSAHMNNLISSSMTEQYNLSSTKSGKLKSYSMRSSIEDIYHLNESNLSICGTKTFLSIPQYDSVKIQDGLSANENHFLTKHAVKDLISKENVYIDSNSNAKWPFVGDSTYIIEDQTTEAEEYFCRWRFADDSVVDVDKYMNTNVVEVQHTGQLVIWGWIADSGTIDPEKAWIGAFGKIQRKWFPLQIQPWIRGEFAGLCQYVGFTLNVQEGLEIRFRSGFKTNPSIQSGLQNPGSLMYQTNQPCSLFGHIIPLN